MRCPTCQSVARDLRQYIATQNEYECVICDDQWHDVAPEGAATMSEAQREQIVKKAREACAALRDAARDGIAMNHFRRDPLVMAIHAAIDLAEAQASVAPAPQAPSQRIAELVLLLRKIDKLHSGCVVDTGREAADALSALQQRVEQVTAERDEAERDYPRLQAQAMAISEMLGEAGIGPCTIPEGVRLLIAAKEAAEATIASLRAVLSELVALVRGECPSLLNEDSGGDARLSMTIDAALASLPSSSVRTAETEEP